MEGNKFGKILLAAILLIAVGTVFSTTVSQYLIEKDIALQQAYDNGLAEMHNSMSDSALSTQEVVSLHQNQRCYSNAL